MEKWKNDLIENKQSAVLEVTPWVSATNLPYISPVVASGSRGA